MSLETEIDTLVLGIGNLLWADEGFGVRAVEALHADYRFSPDVRLMDGGTQGLFLLTYVHQAKNLLIFDAIDFGLSPGELRLIRDDAVPRYLGAKKISMHQTGFQEVLALANFMSDCPKRLALVGIQPREIDDYGGSLRPQVKARIPEAISLAIDVLRGWGLYLSKRKTPPGSEERINPTELEIDRYENGRPHMFAID
jgi:hydrogenase maturation protease